MSNEIPEGEPRRIRTEEPRRRRIGRPRKKVSKALIERLAKAQLTDVEISRIAGISVDTLHRRFAEPIKNWRAEGVGTVRRRLFETAMGKSRASTTAMIFFLKNYGAMRDNVAVTGPDGGPLQFRNVPDDEIDSRIRELLIDLGLASEIDRCKESTPNELADRESTPSDGL